MHTIVKGSLAVANIIRKSVTALVITSPSLSLERIANACSLRVVHRVSIPFFAGLRKYMYIPLDYINVFLDLLKLIDSTSIFNPI